MSLDIEPTKVRHSSNDIERKLAAWDDMRLALGAAMVILETIPWPDDLGSVRPLLERREQVRAALVKANAAVSP